MKNRWLIAAAAVGIHISIGTVYAYSVLRLPLFEHYGWADAVKVAFSIAIVFLGLSAAFMGHFVERYGPRRAGTVAGLFYGIGIIGAGLACLMAGKALAPVLDQAVTSPAVTAVMTDLGETVGAALPTPAEGETLGAYLAERKADVQAANAAVGAAAGADGDTYAAAAAAATQARAIHGGLIDALVTPAASGWQWLFLLCYGVLGGIGLGVGYISPVSTLVKWFPDRRGLATGLAIMGFGFAALVFSPIMESLISAYDPAVMFLVLGSVYLVLMLGSASYLAPPPKDWVPAGFAAKVQSGAAKPTADLSQMTANEAVTTRRFAYLWIMLFINVTCGIALLSVASPMAQEMGGLSPAQAAVMVGLMGLFNGLGRIGWASVSDFIGRSNTYLAFFIIQIAAFMLLPQVVAWAILFQVVVFLIITCYGGGFASIPAFIGDLFGTKQLGAIHGYVLTAWAAAGIAGPITANTVRSWTGDYAMTLTIFAGLFVVVLVVSILMKLDIARLRRRQHSESAPSAPPSATAMAT